MDTVADLHFPNLEELKQQIADASIEADALSVFAYNELMRAGRSLTVLLDQRFSPAGTSTARSATMWYIMQAELSNKQGATPAEIADALHVTRATVTVVLRVLEEGKLVRKRRSTTDGRKYHVKLTAVGKRMLNKTWPQQAAVVTDAMGDLTKQEKHQLIKLVGKLRSKLHRMNGANASA